MAAAVLGLARMIKEIKGVASASEGCAYARRWLLQRGSNEGVQVRFRFGGEAGMRSPSH